MRLPALIAVSTALLTAAPSDPEAFLANATPYLHLVGHTLVATLWLEQVLAAEPGADSDPFLRGKLAAARYFVAWELPQTAVWASLLAPIERTPLDLDPDCL